MKYLLITVKKRTPIKKIKYCTQQQGLVKVSLEPGFEFHSKYLDLSLKSPRDVSERSYHLECFLVKIRLCILNAYSVLKYFVWTSHLPMNILKRLFCTYLWCEYVWVYNYRVSHGKEDKVILLCWGYPFWFCWYFESNLFMR